MILKNYIDSINRRYKLGNFTEHTFRGDLQQLLETMIPDIRATNEPQRQACGAPDYILTRKDIPVGFIEAKDIGDNDLEGNRKAGNKEQFDRYKQSLGNLIFTDYLDFHFYEDGEFVTKIAIAHITNKGIEALPQNFKQFENRMLFFCIDTKGQSIKSSKKLAEMITEITKAQLLTWRLGVLRNEGRATTAQISMAKRNNVDMAINIAREARQILGGMGITGEYSIMRHSMNLESVITYEGTHDIHLLITGMDITGIPAFK